VIFVGMCQNEANEIFPLGNDEAQVRQDDVGAWFTFVRERYAKIDHEPRA
jgi:hypothetical protein